MRSLSYLIWMFLYCRNVFSLLLKIIFSRSVNIGSSSFCCRDVLVLSISVWRWLISIFVHLILLWMSEHSDFFIMACSNLLPFHLICKVFAVTSFARHLRLKILAVLDLASCREARNTCNYVYSCILTQAVDGPGDLRPIATEKEALVVYQSVFKFNTYLKRSMMQTTL